MLIFLFLINSLVYLAGDTLKFIEGDRLVDLWFIVETTPTEHVLINRQAKVSDDHQYFFIHEETYYTLNDSISTKIKIYDAGKKIIMQKTLSGERKINYYLTSLYNKTIFLGTTDKNDGNPSLILIKNGNNQEIINENQWQYIVKYEVSPNLRYMVLQTKNPHLGKTWDYIYFIDLMTKKNWEYLFPVCFSCKRGRIDLSVDNNGQVNVVHRNEHRIFSEEGRLIDIYIKLD